MTSQLFELVMAARDDGETAVAIESARDEVTADAVAALAGRYGSLTTWPQRAALVHLLQDFDDPAMEPMMLHFLVQSPEGDADSDWLPHARAIALSYLDGDLEGFMALLDDPAAVAAGRARWAAKAGA